MRVPLKDQGRVQICTIEARKSQPVCEADRVCTLDGPRAITPRDDGGTDCPRARRLQTPRQRSALQVETGSQLFFKPRPLSLNFACWPLNFATRSDPEKESGISEEIFPKREYVGDLAFIMERKLVEKGKS